LWDEVLDQLKAVDEGLWFEVSEPGGGDRELVITAEGDPGLFPLVQALVEASPRLPGWIFVALKPPGGFDFTLRYDGVQLEPGRLWFLPLTYLEAPAALGLRVGVPGLDPDQQQSVENGLHVLLDTALGERAAAELAHLEVCELPEAPEAAGFVELPELAQYLDYHRRKHPRS
jgi:hypothetical protein